MNNARSDKEKELQKLIDEELERENIEKYNTWIIGNIVFIPTILVLCCLVYLGYLFFTKWLNDASNQDWIYFSVFACITFTIYAVLNDEWEKKRNVKSLLNEGGGLKYEFNFYDDSYFTDSLIKYITYSVLKILFYLLNFGAGLFAIFLVFNWLGTVSIAPTTIIIILLIIIIINQNKK